MNKSYNQKYWYGVRTNVAEEPYVRYKASDPDEAADFALQDECFRYANKVKNISDKTNLKNLIAVSKQKDVRREVQKYFRILAIRKEE